MKMMSAMGDKTSTAAGARSPSARLPTKLAFVVQLGEAADVSPPHVFGHVEHVASGRRRRFRSEADLLAALRDMMDLANRDTDLDAG